MPPNRKFIVDLTSFETSSQKGKHILLKSNTPLSVRVNPCSPRSARGFLLPYIPNSESQLPADQLCVLQVWEVDRSSLRKEDDYLAESDLSDSPNQYASFLNNELLGEIQGYIKEHGRVNNYIFISNFSPPPPTPIPDVNKGKVIIRIPRPQPNGSLSPIDWIFFITGEIELRLEIGVSLRTPSQSMDFTKKTFIYPLIYLDNIITPPVKEQIVSAWRYKWKIWKEQKEKNADWHLDCGSATRLVYLLMGGRENKRTLYYRNKKEDIWYSCAKKDGEDAMWRNNHGFHDRIESNDCILYSGGTPVDVTTVRISLLPGMRIHFSEECHFIPSKGWTWGSTHMVMFTGDNNIIDSINLNFPEAHAFRDAYNYKRKTGNESKVLTDSQVSSISNHWFCSCGYDHYIYHMPIILRVDDPFSHLR